MDLYFCVCVLLLCSEIIMKEYLKQISILNVVCAIALLVQSITLSLDGYESDKITCQNGSISEQYLSQTGETQL